MECFKVQPIGVLHGDLQRTEDAPKNYDESDHIGVLEIFPAYQPGLAGIDTGQTVVALFWMHQADRSILSVHPRGDRSRSKRGVFSTRSPARPNPIAISELTVLTVGKGKLTVSGVDVIDQTPLLDIKKKID